MCRPGRTCVHMKVNVNGHVIVKLAATSFQEIAPLRQVETLCTHAHTITLTLTLTAGKCTYNAVHAPALWGSESDSLLIDCT